jgi:hypothetical protein
MIARARAKLCATLALVSVFTPLVARAADVPYAVTIDGRPIDARGASGLQHNGVMYVDVIRAVKTFDGLLTLGAGGLTRVTIGTRTIDFRIGNRNAYVGTTRLRLPGAPFVANGDTFVPLATIANLAMAKVTIDTVHHLDRLTLPTPPAPTPTPAPTVSPAATSDEIVPSPAQALHIATVARSDPAGLHARADITNRTGQPYTITFPTARQIEFIVSRNGTEIWNSGIDPAMTGGASPVPDPTGGSSLVVPARGTTSMAADWRDYAKAGVGRYTLRVRLLTAIPLDEAPISLDNPQPGT